MRAQTLHRVVKRGPRRTMIAASAMMLLLASCGSDEPTGEPAETVEGEEAASSDEPEVPESSSTESADDTEDEGEATSETSNFYEGKTITILVPAAPGGGADSQAQLHAKAFEDHVPGSPDVEIEYREGAGGMEAGQQFASYPDHSDGTQLIHVNFNMLGAWLMGEEAVAWDQQTLQPIGAIPSTHLWGINVEETGYEQPADLLEPDVPLRFGGRAPNTLHVGDVLMMEVLGIHDDVQKIWGYSGSGEYALAFEQGESNLFSMSTGGWLSRMDMLAPEGEARQILTLGYARGGEVVRDNAHPDVPTYVEFYEELYGEEPSGEIFEAAFAATQARTWANAVSLHGDAPQEAVDTLRQAYIDASEDPEWMAMKEELIGPGDVNVGDAVIEQAEDAQNLDPEILTFMQEWIAEHYPDMV